jgi:2-hydroxychromene-2-carboxylate isomerase
MEWLGIFKHHAVNGEEVDLIYFNQDYDANVCERIAARHGMTFEADREHDTAFLRRSQQD